MMDDDWDLYAVVKGCAAASTTTVGGATSTENHFPNGSSNYSSSIDNFPNFHNINQEMNSFDLGGLLDIERNDSLEGLQEIYQQFCVDPDQSPTNFVHHEIVPLQQIRQELEDHVVQFKNPGLDQSASLSLPIINSQPIRQRRRKNQQVKVVHEMTQEELSGDSWAWRKYGQKPIKGSPYPRNYYRCSTSKSCAARKQVERSPNDPLIFIVSYTGEHTHPRPTHRSSLAGSTRNKISTTTTTTAPAKNKNNNNNNTKHLLRNGSNLSSLSPASGSSFSPSSPLIDGGDEGEDNKIMIPNDDDDDDDNEDLFKMLRDSDHSNGTGGDLFSSGNLL